MGNVQVCILNNESVNDVELEKFVIDVEYKDIHDIVNKVDEYCDEYELVDTYVYIISDDFTQDEINYLEDYWVFVHRTDEEVRSKMFA